MNEVKINQSLYFFLDLHLFLIASPCFIPITAHTKPKM